MSKAGDDTRAAATTRAQFTVGEMCACTGAELVRGDHATVLMGVCTDTRNLQNDELFVALQGPNFDGNRFAGEAVRRGAGGLLLRREDDPMLEMETTVEKICEDKGLAVALHPTPKRALGDLATWHRGRLQIPVLGITGSCGKTTTKNIVAELLAGQANVTASPSSFNNDVGVPHTLLMAASSTQVLVVEMGTNSPGEIEALCTTAQPNCGIITNVGASHLEGLGSIEGVAEEKSQLARSLPKSGFCVLNADCRFTPRIADCTRARVVTFSVDGDGDYDANEVLFHGSGTTFQLHDRGAGTSHEVTTSLLGLHAVQNIMAAIAACREMGFSMSSLLPGLARLREGRRRLEKCEIGGITLFDDSYNANPESARASVRVLCGLHGHARRVLVLGDMLELGDFSGELHHKLGHVAAEAGVDLLVLVGVHVAATAAGAIEAGFDPAHVVHFPELADAIQSVPGMVRDGDVVVVKASRSTQLDRVAAAIIATHGEGGEG